MDPRELWNHFKGLDDEDRASLIIAAVCAIGLYAVAVLCSGRASSLVFQAASDLEKLQ